MNSFEYASPTSIGQAVSLLGTKWGAAEILAGGTDLVALMKDYVVTPARLVNVKTLPGLDTIQYSATQGLSIGALVTISEIARNAVVAQRYPALALAIGDAASPQIRNRATIAGNLCQRPRCWYFRNGYGLLAMDAKKRSLVLDGDNRYHAILGNAGPAYFVSPSTIAPTLIALGAQVQIAGPKGTRSIALGDFYVTPKAEGQREHNLAPNEIVTGVRIPPPDGSIVSYYEVRQKHAFDWPIAIATVAVKMQGPTVSAATVVMGHVAPVPWRSAPCEAALVGQTITAAVADTAAQAAVAPAKSLGGNQYKISVAKVAVARAIRVAGGLDPLT
jgi:xanthine dehydrogenase YagS FAD-binding subunit